MSGRLIVLEGLDGAGKTTLATLLSAELGAVMLATPDLALRDVRPSIDALYADVPDAAQLFYASTVAHASAVAKRETARGRDVVLDRYWLSTWAYAASRGTTLQLAEVEVGLRAADITFLLVLDVEGRRARLRRRGANEGDRRSLEPDVAFRVEHRYREGLLRRVAGCPRILDVAGKSPEACVREMLAALADLTASSACRWTSAPGDP